MAPSEFPSFPAAAAATTNPVESWLCINTPSYARLPSMQYEGWEDVKKKEENETGRGVHVDSDHLFFLILTQMQFGHFLLVFLGRAASSSVFCRFAFHIWFIFFLYFVYGIDCTLWGKFFLAFEGCTLRASVRGVYVQWNLLSICPRTVATR